MEDYSNIYLGIDVGSTSARCAAATEKGYILSTAVYPIKTWKPQPEFYQQSSDDIWNAVCKAVQKVLLNTDVNKVKGIGFDATCSLVVLNNAGKPLSVSLKVGEREQNVILWMDHRATCEADEINAKKLYCLKFLGGTISPEMQPPKIMWLKKNLPERWSDVGYLMDLPDFLTWKATGSNTRSLCSVVCKWLYQANASNQGWDNSVWKELKLNELTHNNNAIIGNVVLMPGEPCGNGLSDEAAKEFGLRPGIPVSTSMIDAHAGGIGTLGCLPAGISEDITSCLAVISGTSTCHMKISKDSISVPGIWGPYFSAMIPFYYLNEAGQSAAGSLIDYVIDTHPAANKLKTITPPESHIQQELNMILQELATHRDVSLSNLTHDLHIWPDFHGNRSPLADPTLKGMVMGLTLSTEVESLARLYLATVQALAYGTRHIIETMRESGHLINSLVMCGGLSKNSLFVQTHADATGLPIVLPEETESVLLGSVILGAAASGNYKSLQDAMMQLGGSASTVCPNISDQKFHDKKYKVFLSLVELQKKSQEIMKVS